MKRKVQYLINVFFKRKYEFATPTIIAPLRWVVELQAPWEHDSHNFHKQSMKNMKINHKSYNGNRLSYVEFIKKRNSSIYEIKEYCVGA